MTTTDWSRQNATSENLLFSARTTQPGVNPLYLRRVRHKFGWGFWLAISHRQAGTFRIADKPRGLIPYFLCIDSMYLFKLLTRNCTSDVCPWLIRQNTSRPQAGISLEPCAGRCRSVPVVG